MPSLTRRLRALRPSRFVLLLAAYTGLIVLGYAAIFLFAGGLSLGAAMRDALVNGLSLFLLGLLFSELLARFAGKRPFAWQVVIHLLLGMLYSLVFYWAVLSIFALLRGSDGNVLLIRPFPEGAQLWQLLQGFTVFALVAALGRAAKQETVAAAQTEPAEAERGDGRRRLLLRRDDEIHPIDVSDIVAVVGADDYAELVLPAERRLSRLTLAQFEEALPVDRFLRVHRSHIVNIDRLVRAEPGGGGRMLLHMESGDVLPTSRAGARLIRQRAV